MDDFKKKKHDPELAAIDDKLASWLTPAESTPSHGRGNAGWWTPARVTQATTYLQQNAGLSPIGAHGLVSRWAGVEARGGPGSRNPNGGAIGIGQWLGSRANGVPSDFEGQLAHAAKELNGSEGAAARRLRTARTPQEAAVGASMYERAEGYNPRTGADNYVNQTVATMHQLGGPAVADTGGSDTADPNFDFSKFSAEITAPPKGHGTGRHPNVSSTYASQMPAPETQATLEAQRMAAHDPESSRAGVLYTPGETPPPLDENAPEFDIPIQGGQTLRVNQDKFREYAAQTGVTFDDLASGRADFTPLIGSKAQPNGQPLGATGPAAVITTDAKGSELVSSAVTDPSAIPAEAALHKKQFPNQPIQTTVATPEDVVALRQQGPEQEQMPTEPATDADFQAANDYLASQGKEPLTREAFDAAVAKPGGSGEAATAQTLDQSDLGVQRAQIDQQFQAGTPMVEAKTDQDVINKGAAGSFAVDLTKKPAGENVGRYLVRTGLEQLAPEYGITDGEISDALDYLKEKNGQYTSGAEDLTDEELAANIKNGDQTPTHQFTIQNSLLNHILNKRDGLPEDALNPAISEKVTMANAQMDKGPEVSRGIDAGYANPPTLTPDEQAGAESLGDWIKRATVHNPIGSTLVTNILSGLGSSLASSQAGLERLGAINPMIALSNLITGATSDAVSGGDSAAALDKLAAQARVVGETAKGDGLVLDYTATAGQAIGQLPLLAATTTLAGGNPVIGFGLESLLTNTDKPFTEQVKGVTKAAIIGAFFGGVSRFAKWAGPAVFDQLVSEETATALKNPAFQRAYAAAQASGEPLELNPDLKRALIGRMIAEKAAPLGLVTAAGYASAAAEGGSEYDRVKNAILFGAMQLLGESFGKKKGEAFTADEVNRANETVVRVPDDSGKPHDVLLLKGEDGKLEAFDATGEVPDETVQAQVLPKSDFIPTLSPEDVAAALDPRETGITPQTPQPTTEDIQQSTAETGTPLLADAPIDKITGLPQYQAPSEEVPADFDFNQLKTELTAPPTRPVEPKETIEPGTPVMIDGKGEGVVTADNGKGVTVEHTPKVKKSGETVYQSVSNVPKKDIQIISDRPVNRLVAEKAKPVEKVESETPIEDIPIIAKEGKFSGSLNIPRAEMPQISGADHAEFVKFAKSRGVEIKPEEVKAHVLKPTQRSYNPEHAEGLPDEALDKPLMVSSDNRVLDGHNRLVRLLADGGRTVTINRLPLPAKQALELMKEFPKTTYKKLNQVGATPEISTREKPVEKAAEKTKAAKVPIAQVRAELTDALMKLRGWSKERAANYGLKQLNEEGTRDMHAEITNQLAEKEAPVTPDGYVNGRPVVKLGTSPGKIKVQFLDGAKETPFEFSVEKPVESVPTLPESQQVSPDADPTATEAKASVKIEKVNPRTGLTKTQAGYLSAELTRVTHEALKKIHKFDTNKEFFAKWGEAFPPEQAAKIKLEMPDFIKVPGDGKFRLVSADSANRLHQKFTGQPIEGFAKTKGASMPREFNFASETRKPSLGKPSKDIVSKIEAEQERLADELAIDPHALAAHFSDGDWMTYKEDAATVRRWKDDAAQATDDQLQALVANEKTEFTQRRIGEMELRKRGIERTAESRTETDKGVALKSITPDTPEEKRLAARTADVVTADEFDDAALALATLDLEDDQVRYPNLEGKKETHIGSGKDYDLYILDRDTIPSAGPFEVSIEQNGNAIGFIRATVSDKVLSINLIHLGEEYRGEGIGTEIYRQFLDDGYTIKSDSEITDATYSLYDRLVKDYEPLIFGDGRIGLRSKADPNILKKVRTAESKSLQSDLTKAATSEVLSNLTGGELKDNGEVELSEADAEIIRRLRAEQHFQKHGKEPDEKAFDAIIIEKRGLQTLVDFGKTTGRQQLIDAGLTNLDNYDKLLGTLDEAAKADTHAIAYVYEESLGHERTHKEDLKLGRSTSDALAKAKESVFWQNPGDEFNKAYAGLSDADKMSEIATALANDEAAMWGWDKLPDYEAAKESFLTDWANDLIDQNEALIGDIGIDEFAKRFPTVFAFGAQHEKITTPENKTTGTPVQGGGSDEALSGTGIRGPDEGEASAAESPAGDQQASSRADVGELGRSPTSTKNAVVDREREARGLPPIMKQAAKDFSKVWDKVMAELDRNPEAGRDLVDELARQSNKVPNDEENALLVHRKIVLQNQYEPLADGLFKAMEGGDETEIAAARLRLAPIADALDKLDQVTEAGGTAAGRALSARRMMVNADFTLAALERRARVSLGGRQLDNEELEKLKDIADEYKARTEELEKHLSERDTTIAEMIASRPNQRVEAAAEIFIQRLDARAKAARALLRKGDFVPEGETALKSVSPGALKSVTPESPEKPDKKTLSALADVGAAHMAVAGLDYAKWSDKMRDEFGDKIEPLLDTIWKASNDVFNGVVSGRSAKDRVLSKADTLGNLTDRIQDKLDNGNNDISDLVQRLAMKLVDQGVTDRDELVDGVHDVLQEINPEITRRDAADAISGYGRWRPLSKEENAAILRDLKGQLQQISKLEDMAEGRAPSKTGMEHRTPSDEERRLIKEVEDAKRRGGYSATDPETQLKSSQASIKTRLENRIADIQDEIDHKTLVVKVKHQTASTPGIDDLRKKLAEVKALHEEIFGKPVRPGMTDAQKLAAWKTRATNRLNELTQKVGARDFTKRAKPAPVELDAEALKLKAAVADIVQQFNRGIRENELKNRLWWEKALTGSQKYRRAALLSGPAILEKLTAAAVARVVLSPAEQAFEHAWGLALPGIAKQMSREYGFRTMAEAKAITEMVTSGMADSWANLRMKDSNLDLVYGKPHYDPKTKLEYFGYIHGALKAPVKRAAFARYFQLGMMKVIKDGGDPLDDVTQMQVGMEAYKAANRSIFMQDNFATDAWMAAVSSLKRLDPKTGHARPGPLVVATIMQDLLPIVKIPTNFVGESIKYSPIGLPVGLIKAGIAYHKGAENLDPADADLIMRWLKKGTLGDIALLLGVLFAASIGGYYQGPRDDKDVKAGGLRLFGVDIMPVFLHNPFMEAMQIGATFRRVIESKLNKKDEDTQGVAAALLAASLGLVSEVPFIKETADIGKLLDPKTRSTFMDEQAKSWLVPQLLSQSAEYLDKPAGGGIKNYVPQMVDPVKRKPNGLFETMESGIPGLRTYVPAASELKSGAENRLDPSKVSPGALSAQKFGVDKQLDLFQAAKAQGTDTPEMLAALKDKLDHAQNQQSLTKEQAEAANQIFGEKAYTGKLAADEQFPKAARYSKNVEGFFGTIAAWAEGFGHDPVDAFNKWWGNETILRLENGEIIVKRMAESGPEGSEAIKKARGGGGKEVKLDHTIPLEIGGSNDPTNLRLVTTAEWASYTPMENYLAGALHDGAIGARDAQKLILDFKNGKIDEKGITNQVGIPYKRSDYITQAADVPESVQTELNKYDISVPNVGDDIALQKHGAKTRLTGDAYTQYRDETQQQIYTYLQEAIQNPDYAKAPADEQEQILKTIIRRVRSKTLRQAKGELAPVE